MWIIVIDLVKNVIVYCFSLCDVAHTLFSKVVEYSEEPG